MLVKEETRKFVRIYYWVPYSVLTTNRTGTLQSKKGQKISLILAKWWQDFFQTFRERKQIHDPLTGRSSPTSTTASIGMTRTTFNMSNFHTIKCTWLTFYIFWLRFTHLEHTHYWLFCLLQVHLIVCLTISIKTFLFKIYSHWCLYMLYRASIMHMFVYFQTYVTWFSNVNIDTLH